MKIAIIAWGSLVHDPKTLRIKDEWRNQGPRLQIEFSRVSKDGRLTLVVDDKDGVEVQTYYAQSVQSDLGDAIADLRDREGTTRKRIGFVEANNGNCSISEFSDQIDITEIMVVWCKDLGFEAAVWTALPPQFEAQTKTVFSVDNAIVYLKGLPLSARKNALEYIEKAPKEIVTPVRQKIEQLNGINWQE